MEPDEIRAQVAELDKIQPWNHNITLPGNIETRPAEQQSHGKNLIKLERLKPLFDAAELKNKRILDVGCNEGFFSCHMAGEGANVLGIDIDENRIKKANFVRSVLNLPELQFRQIDIYSKEFDELPEFDLCLNLGFLHRVPDPFTALAALAKKANIIIFEWKALKFGPHDDAFAYFSPKQIDHDDYYGTEYWLLSYAAVERILRRLGMTNFYRLDDPRQRRAILVAGRTPSPLFDQQDSVIHRGRLAALGSHTKRYIKTVSGVLAGRINA